MSSPRRDPAIQARLDAWAVWLQRDDGGHGGSCGNSPLSRLMDWASGQRVTASSGPLTCRVPVDEIECSRTDAAVRALPPELAQAVRAWHCAREGTLEGVARQLGVVKTTLWRRLAQADLRIAAALKGQRRRA